MKLQKYKLGEPLDVKRGVSLTGADKIKDCVVWIPDLEEQKRIASILSALDNKIALNREINQNLATPDRSSGAEAVRRAA